MVGLIVLPAIAAFVGTVGTADTAVILPLAGAIANGCACASRTLTLVLTGAESVVSSATVEVTQVA